MWFEKLMGFQESSPEQVWVLFARRRWPYALTATHPPASGGPRQAE